MARIDIPSTEQTPAASAPLLQMVNKRLGRIPNLMKVVSSSAVALQGYLQLSEVLEKGSLSKATAERIALAVAEINGCNYCLSAHSYLATHVANLADSEIEANRRGTSTDQRAAAAVSLAVKIVNSRGHISDADLTEIKAAGYDSAEIIEIVLHVALNTLTNYVNNVALTDIDFPEVSTLRQA